MLGFSREMNSPELKSDHFPSFLWITTEHYTQVCLHIMHIIRVMHHLWMLVLLEQPFHILFHKALPFEHILLLSQCQMVVSSCCISSLPSCKLFLCGFRITCLGGRRNSFLIATDSPVLNLMKARIKTYSGSPKVTYTSHLSTESLAMNNIVLPSLLPNTLFVLLKSSSSKVLIFVKPLKRTVVLVKVNKEFVESLSKTDPSPPWELYYINV